MKRGFGLAAVGLLMAVAIHVAWAAPGTEEVYPAEPDRFAGEYVGRWNAEETVNPEVAAQIIALGDNVYRVRVFNKLDMRCPILAQVEVKPKGGELAFESDPYFGKTDGVTFTGGRDRGKFTFQMERVNRQSPTLGKTPPEGAVVLFDGSGLDAWQNPEGWQILPDGALMVVPDGKDLVSKGVWGDIELHIEFRLPFKPPARGQQRGNSGVFVQSEYEVQVLDSFGLDGYYDECGALYKLSAPHVNACYPPLAWQAYDITYRAPRYGADGNLSEFGRMTVYHNGVLIHNDQELTWITGWKEKDRMAAPPREPGHIKLQAHHDHMQYRNIWLVAK